jgi:hypothetical protein
MYWNIKVIATDVVDRPKGTVLFKYNDLNDFSKKLNKSLNLKNYGSFNYGTDNFHKIIEQYNSMV